MKMIYYWLRRVAWVYPKDLIEDLWRHDWGEARYDFWKIWDELVHPFRWVWYGLENTIAYLPVIWVDRDWDWQFIMRLWEKKFRRMAHYAEKYGHLVDSPKQAKEYRVCADLCKRLGNNEYFDYSKINLEPMKRAFKNPVKTSHGLYRLDVEDSPADRAAFKREHKKEEVRIKADIAYLTSMVNKRLRTWWD